MAASCLYHYFNTDHAIIHSCECVENRLGDFKLFTQQMLYMLHETSLSEKSYLKMSLVMVTSKQNLKH